MARVKILVVEDKGIVARDVQNTLEWLGYEVPAVVASGEAAVEKAAEVQPDLVLMDVKLKGEMDGIEAAEQIRAQFDIPVVYLMAHTDQETLKRAQVTDPFGYVLKPFGDRELQSNVEMALYKHRMEDKLRESEERFRALFDDAPDAIFLADPESGIILDANAAASRLLQKPHQEIVGLHQSQLHPPRLAEHAKKVFAEHVRQIQQGTQTRPIEIPVFRSDGSEVLVEVLAHIVYIRGKPVLQGVFRDITEHKRAEEEHRQRERFLASLNDITRAALETPDLKTMMQTLADRMGELFDADGCYLTLWDEATQMPIMGAAYGAWREAYPSIRVEPGEVTMTGSVLRARRPLVVEDVFDTPYLSRRIAELFPDRSLLGLPLIAEAGSGGQPSLLGAALIAFNEPHRFTQEEITHGEQAARQIALAVAKARLLEEAQSRWRETETLRQAGAAVTETLSLDETLAQILAQLDRVVPYNSASIQLLREGHLEIVSGRGFPDLEAVIGLKFPVPDDNPNTVVVESRRPFILTDAPAAHAPFRTPPHSHIKSWLGVPLIVRDRVIGMLAADSVERGYFDERHVRLAVPFANQAAIAIENARLVEGLEAEVAARTAEIAAEREKSETILRSVADAIAMIDLEMRIQYVNDAFITLTGHTAEKALGQQYTDLLAGGAMPEPSRHSLRRALNRGEVWQGEVIARRRDGRHYDAELTITPMHDAEGRLVAYVSSHRDIGRIKELEKARRQFMTNISHELRTPLSNIKLYAQLLQIGRRPEKTEHYLHVLVEQADRLGALIQDILEMTGLDAGRVVTAWAPIALPTLITDTVTRYQSRAEASGLTLVGKSVPSDLPPVKGDQRRLTQALGEMVDNAIVFTPEGGQVILEVGTAEEEEQRWVTISVSDTGPGISPEEQERVFDRFYRGTLAQSGHIPGTGLGLSIAQEIVRAHGGRIELGSQEGEGSTFVLWLRGEV